MKLFRQKIYYYFFTLFSFLACGLCNNCKVMKLSDFADCVKRSMELFDSSSNKDVCTNCNNLILEHEVDQNNQGNFSSGYQYQAQERDPSDSGNNYQEEEFIETNPQTEYLNQLINSTLETNQFKGEQPTQVYSADYRNNRMHQEGQEERSILLQTNYHLERQPCKPANNNKSLEAEIIKHIIFVLLLALIFQIAAQKLCNVSFNIDNNNISNKNEELIEW